MTDVTRAACRAIARWCSDSGQSESTLLYPDAQHFVYTFDLFDFLVRMGYISKEEIGAVFNDRQASHEVSE